MNTAGVNLLILQRDTCWEGNKMAKKSLSIILSIAFSCVAILSVGCLIGSWISGFNDASNASNMDAMNELEESQPVTKELEESYIFRSLEDYASFMSESNGVVEISNEIHATIDIESCLVPTNLPDDATLQSIEVGTEGTVFTYDLSRRDGSIVYDEDDPIINDLLHTMRSKAYNPGTFDFIESQHEYCRNLAAAIGATPVNGSNEHYIGPVYAYTRSEAGAPLQKVRVGTQELKIFAIKNGTATNSIDGDVPSTFVPDTSYVICYYYYPVTVSEQEAADFVNSMETLVIE